MTLDHIKKVLQEYDAKLLKDLVLPCQLSNYDNLHDPDFIQLEHIRWMCQKAQWFCDNGEEGKANRWLGFIQGVLYANGEMTISEQRDHNRSDWSGLDENG